MQMGLQGKILEKVFKVAKYTAMSKDERKEYEESLKNYNDLQNTLETTEREGFEKGFNKGIEEITPLLEEERRLKEEERKQKEEERRLKEEERKLKEEERKLKEEAKITIKTMIQKLISKGFSVEEIANDLNKSIAEINEIIVE